VYIIQWRRGNDKKQGNEGRRREKEEEEEEEPCERRRGEVSPHWLKEGNDP
jgi:hypothetical protein